MSRLSRRAAASTIRAISVLHGDILSLVFAFTPIRARILTLSLVCKRWRVAAVRSVRHLELQGDLLQVDVVQKLIRNFPLITSVSLRYYASKGGSLALPAQLTRLKINIETYKSGPLCFTSHFASLTALSLRISDTNFYYVSVFLKRHCAILLKLKIYGDLTTNECARNILRFLSEDIPDGLPALLELHLPTTELSTIQCLITRAPSLTTLTLSAYRLADIMPIPISTLVSCKNLHLRFKCPTLGSEVEWIKKLSNLRSLNCLSQHSALAPYVTFHTLTRSEPWYTLATYTALRSLQVSDWGGRVPTTVTCLPLHLKRVSLLGHNAYVQACGVLRVCHRLKYVSITLRDGIKRDEATRQYDTLVDLAIRSGVHTLIVRWVPTYVPQPMKGGWLLRRERLRTNNRRNDDGALL